MGFLFCVSIKIPHKASVNNNNLKKKTCRDLGGNYIVYVDYFVS